LLLGLRTIIYPAPRLAESKAWITRLLGIEPYFDEPFYVGFEVAGYELALNPSAAPEDGPITYWGVRDCDEALAWIIDAGATEREPVTDVGGDIRAATVVDPFGNVIGLIENPHFRLPEGVVSAGPGR
jgi:hypothetical protein